MTLRPAAAVPETEAAGTPVTSSGRRGGRRPRRRKSSRARSQAWAAYLFLAPWFIGLFAVTLGPMIASLYLSFTDYSLLSGPTGWAWTTTTRCSRPTTGT